MGKKAKTPAAPDYTALAEKTAASQNPNQYTPFGTMTRAQNPDGSWSQTTTLDPADQARLDAQRAAGLQATNLASGLMGQYNPTAFESKVGDPGFGAVQQVKDDYLKLLQPEMAQQRSTLENTLRQRGIPIDSKAWMNAQQALMDSEARRGWEATGQATNAYNDIFKRGLMYDENARTNQSQPLIDALRAQSMAMPVGMPTMPSPGRGTDYLSAGDQEYQARLAAANAQNAQRSGMLGGLMGLAGSALGGPIGGMLGSSLGGMFGGTSTASPLGTYSGAGYGYKPPF